MKKEISKYISLILRHKPEVIGISLDEHGWANVSELIEGVSRTHSLDMQMLEKIVNEDEKQRYSFNENKTMIRANQGHSIPVDVELEQVSPPEILWHGTGLKYTESIGEKGLIPKSRLYVHLSQDYATALNVGSRHGIPVVYRVLAKKMEKDGYIFYKSVNGVWLTKEVPKKYLRKLITLYDPIEDTEEYKNIVDEVDKKVDKLVDSNIRLGRCHMLWKEKKRILKEEYGIEWKSIAEMNPLCHFD